jgi:hypothetical protein
MSLAPTFKDYSEDINLIDNCMVKLQEFNTVPYEYEHSHGFTEINLMTRRDSILTLLRDLQDELIHHRDMSK